MFVQWMLNWLVAPSIQNLPGDPVWDPVGFLKLTFRSFQTRRKSSNYRMIHMNHVALTWAHQVPLLSISLLSNLHWASCLLVCPRNAMHNDFLLHSALNSWPWGLYSSSVLQRHLACQGPQLAKCGTTLPDVDIFLGPSYMCLTLPCRCWSCHADVPWFVGCGKSSAQSSEYGVGAGIHGGDETKHCTPHQAQVGQFDFGGEKKLGSTWHKYLQARGGGPGGEWNKEALGPGGNQGLHLDWWTPWREVGEGRCFGGKFHW